MSASHGRKRTREESDIDHPNHKHPEFASVIPHEGNRNAKASSEILAQIESISSRVRKGIFTYYINFWILNMEF